MTNTDTQVRRTSYQVTPNAGKRCQTLTVEWLHRFCSGKGVITGGAEWRSRISVMAQMHSNTAFEQRKDEFRYMRTYDITIDELLGGCKTNKIEKLNELWKNVLISGARIWSRKRGCRRF